MAPEIQMNTETQPTGTEILESMTSEQRSTWELTGEIPALPKKEESASSAQPAKEATSEPPEKEAKPESAPDTDKTAQEREREKTLSRGDKRILELLGKNKALLAENEELRKSKAEVTVVPKPESAPGTSLSPIAIPAALKAKLAEIVGKADQYEEYEDMVVDIIQSIVPEVVSQTLQKQEQSQQAAKVQEQVTNKWMKSLEQAASKHADFGAMTDTPEMLKLIPGGSMLNSLLVDSELGGELLYHLATHKDEIERISALPPIAQPREIFKLETSLSVAPVLNETEAPPPPPRVVGTGHTTPLDPVAKALKDGETDPTAFTRYMDAANAADLKKSRKG